MATSAFLKLACAIVLCMVVAAPHAEALTCGMVTGDIAPCLGYLTGKGGPSPGCCGGVKNLLAQSNTPAARQTSCTCLKQLASGIKTLNYGLAAGLPGKCGVKSPYPISPSTDCSKVH